MKVFERQVYFDPDNEPYLWVKEEKPIELTASQDAIVWNLVDPAGKPVKFPKNSLWNSYGLTVAFEGDSLLGPLAVLDQRPHQAIGMGNNGQGGGEFHYRVYFVRARLDHVEVAPIQFPSQRQTLFSQPGLPAFSPLDLEVTCRVVDNEVVLEVSELEVEIFSGQSVNWFFRSEIRRALGQDYLPNVEFTDFDAGRVSPYGPFSGLCISNLATEPSEFDFKITGSFSNREGKFRYNAVALALDTCQQLTILSESDPQIDDLGPPPSGSGGNGPNY